MDGIPKYWNDEGVAEILIGTRAFHCIGASPPMDHPHVYLNMGEQTDILCPYCGTRFRFDAGMSETHTDPELTGARDEGLPPEAA